MNGRCYRCHQVRDDVETRYELGGFFLCEPCAPRGRPSGLTGTAPRFRGLERAVHVARIVAEDERAGVAWPEALADVLEANRLTFDPPYSDAALRRLLRDASGTRPKEEIR